MASYYVNNNAQSNGDHEIHVPSCAFFPLISSKTYLGEFPSCGPAKQAALRIYPEADGCAFCCSPCHTS